MKPIFLISIALSFLSFTDNNKVGSELMLNVTNIPSIEGKLSILVFNNKEGFPGKKEKAILETTVVVTSKQMKINLGKLSHGKYAIAIIHDKNSNKALDKNFFGLPTEAFGFSNVNKLTFGPPPFSDAAIRFDETNKQASIKLIKI